jgi:hypothetical protein
MCKESKPKEYILQGGSGRSHKYKVKVWEKCTVFKPDKRGAVIVEPYPNCPFETWAQECRDLGAKLRGIADGINASDQLRQVYVCILTMGKRFGLDKGKQREWEEAIGGWATNVDVKARRSQEEKQVLYRNLNSLCDNFYNYKIETLIDHTFDANVKPHANGVRRHSAGECASALAAIPSAFFYSQAGKEMALKLAKMFHQRTSASLKTDRLARFIASDYRESSAAELLDSTVFESHLMLMDHCLPALAVDPSFKLPPPRGFLEFLRRKKLLYRGDLRQMPVSIIVSGSMGIHGMEIKLETLERADTLKCAALSNVLNIVAFLGAMGQLGENQSTYDKLKDVKVTADLISSLCKLSELASIRALSKGAGVIGLGLDGLLASMDGLKQARLSSEHDDRRALAGAHFFKAIGAGLMVVAFPVGAVLYLVGTLGTVAFDSDPYIEWAKHTYFGAQEFANKRFSSSAAALADLQRMMRIAAP